MRAADKDIACYKIIQIYHSPDGDDYRTYFMHTKIELNKPIKAFDYIGACDVNEKSFLSYEVVHAYCKISCDDSDIDWYIEDTRLYPFPSNSKYDVSIAKVKCIIPKGTMFCKGRDDDGNICYGAERIIPVEVIKTISTITR